MQVSVGAGPVRWYGIGALLWWLSLRTLVGVGRLLHLAACHPRTFGALFGSFAVLWAVLTRPAAVLVAVSVVAVAGEVWAVVSPSSWRRHGRARLLAVWRGPSV